MAIRKDIATWCRGEVVRISSRAKTPHVGSCLSVIDILTAIYFEMVDLERLRAGSIDRDRVILSKGHAALAQYLLLNRAGILSDEDLGAFSKTGSMLEEHPNPSVKGVEAATGSLGHGLPIGCGIALGQLIRGYESKTYVVLSDGECNEGSTWEAAIFANANRLKNLIVFVDYNKWQATDRSQEVAGFKSLAQIWSSFGWRTLEVDGHRLGEIVEAVANIGDAVGPSMVICHTVKGAGISFMEDDNNWHYWIPTQDEVTLAFKELGLAE